MSEMEAPEILEVEDGDGDWMDNEVVYEATEATIRNYLEIGVDAGAESASLYFEGRDNDGEIQAGYQYLDADELRALIDAAERALEVVEANQ